MAMASKYLSGTYNAGYTLSAVYTAVTLGGSGSIGGTGLVGNASADTAVNSGRIRRDLGRCLGHLAAIGWHDHQRQQQRPYGTHCRRRRH